MSCGIQYQYQSEYRQNEGRNAGKHGPGRRDALPYEAASGIERSAGSYFDGNRHAFEGYEPIVRRKEWSGSLNADLQKGLSRLELPVEKDVRESYRK